MRRARQEVEPRWDGAGAGAEATGPLRPHGTSTRSRIARPALGGDVLGLGLVGQEDAVAQHVRGDLLDVLGDHVAAAAQERHGARGLREGQGGARARRRRRSAGRARTSPTSRGARVARDERHHVVARGARPCRPRARGRASRRTASPVSTRRHGGRLARDHAVEDLPLLRLRRVVDPHLQQEAVDLRLGQRVGALLLDRVLGGEDQERARAAGGSRRRASPAAPASPRAAPTAPWRGRG